MSEIAKKLWCRKTGSNTKQSCTLYNSTSDCGTPYLCLQVGGVKAYAKLGDVTDSNASAIRVRRKADGKTYAVLMTAINNYYITIYGQKITISSSAAERISENELNGKSTVASVYFESTKQVNYSAFKDYNALKTVTMPNCTYVAADAFRRCSSLQSVTMPNCSQVLSDAFQGCSALKSIGFPVCTKVSTSAFEGCSSLTAVSLPACTEISNASFSGCSSLNSVNLPVCKTVPINAFANCTALRNISLPALDWLYGSAFAGCTNLSSISVPKCDSVYGQFKNCPSLTVLYLPSVYSYVDYNAFANSSLKEVHFAKKYQSKIEAMNGYKATGYPTYYVGKFGKSDLKIYFDL